MGLVPFEGGEVEVEVESRGVAFGAENEGAEGAVEEAGGGAPPCAAEVVIGEGDGVGFGGVGAGLGAVVDGDLIERMGLVVVRWWVRVENWVSHWSCREREVEDGDW